MQNSSGEHTAHCSTAVPSAANQSQSARADSLKAKLSSQLAQVLAALVAALTVADCPRYVYILNNSVYDENLTPYLIWLNWQHCTMYHVQPYIYKQLYVTELQTACKSRQSDSRRVFPTRRWPSGAIWYNTVQYGPVLVHEALHTCCSAGALSLTGKGTSISRPNL